MAKAVVLMDQVLEISERFNKDSRRTLKTTDHARALDEFWRLTKEIANDET